MSRPHPLAEAARNVPTDTVDATARLLRVVGRHNERARFVANVLNALAAVTDLSSGEQRRQPHDAESSDYSALLEMLDQPVVLAELRSHDPLAPARLRGFRLREQLLAAEGGTCSATELGRMLHITRQAVDKRRRAGKLIGLELGRRGYAYPIWQVGLEGLDEVLAALREHGPWSQLAFMLSPNTWLDDETPLARLQTGEVWRVRDAARLYGEQIAS